MRGLWQGSSISRHAADTRAYCRGLSSAAASAHAARRTRRCPTHQYAAPSPRMQQRLQAAAAAEAEEADASYEWSWQQKCGSHLPEAHSQFDKQHPVPAQPSLQDLTPLLVAAAAACEAHTGSSDADSPSPPPGAAAVEAPASLPSQAWLQQLLAAAQPLLQQAPAATGCDVLQLLSRLDFTPHSSWMQQLLTGLCSRLQELSTQQLAGLLWSLSNLRYTPDPQQWQELLQAAQGRLEEFYGPDLALLVCGAGSILSSTSSSFDPEGGVRLQQRAADAAAAAAAPSAPDADASMQVPLVSSSSSSSLGQLVLPAGFADAVLAEVQYQVTEFPADLGAFDLARLASGLADLGISPSTALQDRLMKAVYMRTRTIEEKGAVDFALAKLDAKGKKSMHYDPRWTHEELKWLPRRERDKRRLIKEGWVRTQWTGYG